MPQKQSIGNLLLWMKATICSNSGSMLVRSNGECALHPQEHPIVDKNLRVDDFQSCDHGILDLVWIGHGFIRNLAFCISSSFGLPKIFSLPAFYHIDVHEVFTFWWHTQRLEGPPYHWWLLDWLLLLCARNARTCNRVYRYSSMTNTLCTAFRVPSRAIPCHSHPESFVSILDWKDQMIDFVVDLVEEHVDLDGSQIFWISSRTLVLWACFTTEFGSPGIRNSISAWFTIIDSWLTSVMIINGSLRSFTKYFIFNVERFAFIRRSCLRTVWHINHVMRDNKSHRSLMCLFNIEILSVFRWTCLDYACVQVVKDRDDLIARKMKEKRPVLKRSMLILFAKNPVLVSERHNHWKTPFQPSEIKTRIAFQKPLDFCRLERSFPGLCRSLRRTRFFAKRINIDLLTGRFPSISREIKSPRSLTNWI